MPMRIARLIPALLFASVLLLPGARAAAQAELSTDPLPISCDAPRLAPRDAAPLLRVWRGGADDAGWRPPACTGWKDPGFRLLVEMAGTVALPDAVDRIMAQVGGISRMKGLRYWSVSYDAYRELITAASALSGPDATLVRADFGPAELVPGTDLYFSQTDNRTGGPNVYRLRVVERSDDRIVLTVENVSPIRKLFVTLARPGALQSLHILERRDGGLWSYRMLSRTGLAANRILATHSDSVANRAAALYRYVAGLPDDMMPPAAP